MKDVPYPVIGVDNMGASMMMLPGAEYTFPGNMVTEIPQMGKGGEMIKRKDGSYSRRGLWDNIRANKGSGKKPTKEMLQQERKIKAKMEYGGWLDQYQEGGNTLAKYLKEPEPEKVIPSWLNMSSSLPARAASMIPSANDFNLNDFETGDISDDVKSLFENARVKFQTNKRLGSLGQIKIDTEAKPFAKEGSKLSLPNISMSNSVRGKNANLDYEIGADRQSFSLDSDGFIKGNANYNRQRTGEGFENSADMTLRFPNNRGNVTRSVVYKDNQSPSMSELRGNYRIGNTNINAFSKTEDGEQTYGAGLNTNIGPLDLSGNVGFDNDSLENYMVSGNLNLLKSTERNPNVGNLNLSARYGANRNQQGEMTPNYNIGLRYSNEFKNGGLFDWLNEYQTGGWAGWTPNVGKPYMRTSPAGNAGYSDNTKVVTQNTNVSAENRKAAEAAEYARRVGSVSQGKTKSNYEKARDASSFVSQAEQRKGSADPLDYVLDAVNPAAYPFSAIDLLGNTGSAAVNVAQGDFTEAGSDLLNAGLNALDVVPLTKGLGKTAKPLVKNAAQSVSRYADDVAETSKIAGKFTLPTYKNVYRTEHANFNTLAKPDDVTGRWALNDPQRADFYVSNLKTPRGDSYVYRDYWKGEIEPVRIMRDRLPEYKINQQFGEGMPEEARITSMGTGKLRVCQ
jgi:hypothetical protein